MKWYYFTIIGLIFSGLQFIVEPLNFKIIFGASGIVLCLIGHYLSRLTNKENNHG